MGEKSKIYVFIASTSSGDDVYAIAVAEDGEIIADHISSSVGWAKHDMGLTPTSNWKHDQYRAKYPNGYELVWVDDWKSHPFLSEQHKRNQAQNLSA